MNETGTFRRGCARTPLAHGRTPRMKGSARARLAAMAVAGLIASFAGSGTSAQAADKAYGEYLASECAGCHRPTGPQVGGVRVIHGMDHAALVKALKEYRDKTRPNNVMQNVAGKLVDDDIEALAAYYSSLAK